MRKAVLPAGSSLFDRRCGGVWAGDILPRRGTQILRHIKQRYQSELADILEGCSASEMEAILNIAREVKSSMHKQQNID